jgi:DNA-binding LacI/PurR family transcriptional regulator
MTSPDLAHLLPDERRAHIVDVVRTAGNARVTELATELGVTPITIRRDIELLARRGLVRRVHGGATRIDHEARAAATSPALTTNGDKPTIGLVVPSLDYYWPDVIRSVRESAAEAGVRVVLRGATYEAVDERHQLTRLLDSVGVDGLIVAPTTTGAEGEALVRWLGSLDVPVVLVERAATVGPHHQAMESVVSDHARGAAMAVRYLAELGHRRIGVATTIGSPTSPHVRQGWRDACHELGLPTDDAVDLTTVDCRDASWPDAADSILDACLTTGTTALLVHSDPEAISLVERCQERGLDVPGDLSMVTYDDQVAALSDPPMTAVRPPREAIGRAAVDLLAARLRTPDDERPAHRVIIGPRLVIRESASHPATT